MLLTQLTNLEAMAGIAGLGEVLALTQIQLDSILEDERGDHEQPDLDFPPTYVMAQFGQSYLIHFGPRTAELYRRRPQ
jgi:hypothetical protein